MNKLQERALSEAIALLNSADCKPLFERNYADLESANKAIYAQREDLEKDRKAIRKAADWIQSVLDSKAHN